MSDYYTETAFEVPEVKTEAVKWLRALFNVLNAVDCGESPDDVQDEYRVLLPRFAEMGWEEGTCIEYDGATLCVYGEIRVNALNEVLRCFLERWYPDRTIEYSWSHRSDWRKEVGEFYGGREAVSLVEDAEKQRTLEEAISALTALFREEFGLLVCLKMKARSGNEYIYADGDIRVTGCLMYHAPLACLTPERVHMCMADLPELWQALEEQRAVDANREATAVAEVQRMIGVLKPNRTAK